MGVDVEKIIREYLPDVIHMSLGTCKDGQPWVCEVHFAYDEDLNLYFRSKADRRHSQEIAENARVAGNIVKQIQLGEAPKGVYFEGIAKMIPASNEQAIAFQCMKARIGIGDDTIKEAARDDGHKFYKITVNSWYIFGNFDGEGAKKYGLKWAKQ